MQIEGVGGREDGGKRGMLLLKSFVRGREREEEVGREGKEGRLASQGREK